MILVTWRSGSRGLSKEYRLGAQRERYSTIRDQLNKLASAPFKAFRGRSERSEQRPSFWALKDVSFEVRPGEVVGIIGRNGAGKATSPKILSRITEPTEGEVDIYGRVGSLLEVGTGFHPELTGREYVYLNGAILGMRRADIARKFDEIVAFAEVEKFIDTPVKHYSSGMYMRLAFAVAAHLEPEILIVDEVLAVGDAQFQRKCLGKMEDVARGGRTVLFVSHQMSAVQRLCKQCLLFENGRLRSSGPRNEIIAQYLSADARRSQPHKWIGLAEAIRDGSQEARFVAVRFRCPDPLMSGHPYPDGPLEFELSIESDAPRRVESLAVALFDRYGTKLINADTMTLGEPDLVSTKGRPVLS